jgi:hypothetical protein
VSVRTLAIAPQRRMPAPDWKDHRIWISDDWSILVIQEATVGDWNVPKLKFRLIGKNPQMIAYQSQLFTVSILVGSTPECEPDPQLTGAVEKKLDIFIASPAYGSSLFQLISVLARRSKAPIRSLAKTESR